jgi:CheY-like chemotaxis protein
MKYVLIVNEDKDLLYSIYFTLKRNNFIAVTAQNGTEARDRILQSSSKGKPFDIFIMDFQLPAMAGISLVKEIRTMKIISPIIGITPFNNTALFNMLKSAGCTHFLVKPFTIEDLIKMVLKLSI